MHSFYCGEVNLHKLDHAQPPQYSQGLAKQLINCVQPINNYTL